MLNVFHEDFFSMNTRFSAVWWGIEDSSSKKLFSEIKILLKKLELTLSCYNAESELFKLNLSATDRFVTVSPELFNVLKYIREYRIKSKYYFDPDYLNPTRERIKDILEFDDENTAIKFIDRNTKLDLGGIGKGIALEVIFSEILHGQIENLFLSFGESSILTRGRHPNGEYWPFGLCDLDNKSNKIYDLELKDHAVSVSANKLRIGKDNRIDFHIFDPIKNETIAEDKMIMVKSKSAIDCEVISTALVSAEKEKYSEILDSFDVEEVLEVQYINESLKLNKIV